jgi:hypothetical protein
MGIQQNNQNPPAGRFGGGRFGGNNNNQNQNNNQNNGRPSRFGGGRFGGNNNNQNQNNNNQPVPPRAARPPRFGQASANNNNQRKDWTMLPLNKTVVRFDLDGLGDPFYKILRHEINTEYSHGKAVSQALESGGENVNELETLLDKVWEGYDLQGAMMVYRWNPSTWKGIEAPYPMPSDQVDWLSDVVDDELEEEAPKEPTPPAITCLRALDLPLVLNVLARSRTQVLLTKAPIVFSQQYLNRALVTDDPRIVKLTRATGYLREKL